MSKLLKRLHTLPRDLFRVQNGKNVYVKIKGQHKNYTVEKHTDGKIYPDNDGGLDLQEFGPNLTTFVCEVNDKYVYRIPKGVVVPDYLSLSHTSLDWYSLRTAEPTSAYKLNIRLTKFLHENAELMTKKQYLEKYGFGVYDYSKESQSD